MKGWIFNLVCPGNAVSASHKGLLLLKNVTNSRKLGFDDVCQEKHVSIAYNNEANNFVLSNTTGEMVKYPAQPFVSFVNIAYEWEIQATFFESNNIKPQWHNANWTWGTLNEIKGQWSGAVGMIQRDEADYAICCFGGTYARSKVAAFSYTDYFPQHWLTRYPLELSPTWNLLGLFTKEYSSQMSFLRKQYRGLIRSSPGFGLSTPWGQKAENNPKRGDPPALGGGQGRDFIMIFFFYIQGSSLHCF